MPIARASSGLLGRTSRPSATCRLAVYLTMELNLTQSSIYQELGISRKTYSAWENGLAEPHAKNLRRLATCLKVHAQGNVLYLGEKTGSPQIDDVRVTFTQTPPADVSIIAQVAGNTFEKFTASNGYTFSRLNMGTVGMEKMFAGAESDNATTAWILRVVGTIVVIVGLGAISVRSPSSQT